MKVRWTLFDMTPLKAEHLKANLEYWKVDIVFESVRLLEKMDKSMLIKVVGKSKQAKLIFDMVRNQSQFTKENINELISFDIKEADRDSVGKAFNYVVCIDLFVNNVYFQTQQALYNPGKELRDKVTKIVKRFRTVSGDNYEHQTPQGFIKSLENEFSKYYTKYFNGEILEDDGLTLSVRKIN